MSTVEKRQEILDLFHRRYATKKYDSQKKISQEDFQLILEAGRLAPSSFGYEPWKFLLLENAEMKEDLKSLAGGAINSLKGASHFVIILAKKGLIYNSDYVKGIVSQVLGQPFSEEAPVTKVFKAYQETSGMLKDKTALFDWASKQTYIAMANMMTAAAALDIDSCPIEGFDRQAVEEYLSDKGYLDLEEYGVSVMVSFGYRDEPIKSKQRRPLQEVIEVID